MPYNFINIFAGAVKTITIPSIQRDYAQGRKNLKVNRIRHKFLDALFNAVNGKNIKLDFVYGDLDKNGNLTPLDGQQRLTTLFLLYWYASKKENIPADETGFLKNFSYETRPDSRIFCKELIKFTPKSIEQNLSEEIADQSWFSLSWRKDPTISAMLTMIDAINEKFHSVKNLWQKLANIEFYFLPIENLGLTDEIYITMNSRGKQLTDFEHFKAEFKRRLDDIDAELSKKIILRIDREWTDMLWKVAVRNESYLVDDYFLNYFRFLCDLEIYKSGGIPKKDRDFFVLLDEFFSGNVKNKIAELKKNFECWCECGDTYKFFGDRVLIGSKMDKFPKHAAGKFVGYFQMKTDGNFFADCLKLYDGKLGKFLMLYAFLIYLRNKNTIQDSDFRRRIRIVNNLIGNSEDEIRESAMSTLLQQVEQIIKFGKFLNLNNKQNFNAVQIQEEKLKLEWTQENSELAESLFELEDHYLLYGQIAIIGLDAPQNFKRFISLFKCDYDLIDCTLLGKSDYFQNRKKLYQFGSKFSRSWQNLFHLNLKNEHFEDTKNTLRDFLEEQENFTDDFLRKTIDEYLRNCEKESFFEWNYYYIKYKEFRPARYGKYIWEDFQAAPYMFSALWTEQRKSEKAYLPFLRAAVDAETFKNHYNSTLMRLEFEKYFIECENDAYVIKEIETGNLIDRLKINQDNGIDTEDRILKFKNWYNQL
mgnify:CR=1 FL=1